VVKDCDKRERWKIVTKWKEGKIVRDKIEKERL